jgi:4-hydroxythreonine-4-phosphate dehydrogenase
MPEAAAAPLLLTCGEPAGIAPDITLAAWQALRSEPAAAFAYLGDADFLASRSKLLASHVPVRHIASPADAARCFADALPVLHRPLTLAPLPGKPSAATAEHVIAMVAEAARLALSGEAAGMVTNPIQKETLYQAGFKHQGHTDYLASLCAAPGEKPPVEVMMLVAGGLRTVPVTVHVALKQVPQLLTADLICAQAKTVDRDLRQRFGIAKPRLAVTGLNPHAGENGSMGREEIEIIAPAVERLRAQGIDVSGPISADTAFHEEARATYDAILCMYHDQALIPVKTLDFHGGVNVTLGLPFVRTSPDHGTALSLAGTGKANPRSLIAAIRMAASLSRPKAKA